MINDEKLGDIFEKKRERILEEWSQFLRFKSISAIPEYDADCTDCAGWLADYVQSLGFKARLIDTGTKPVVYAEREGKPGLPTILFYGHYDVQPVDPLEKWANDPFDPVLKDGRLYARGAEDNKGQLLFVLKAMQALIEEGCLDVSVKILIEGEEESGSCGISRVIPEISEMIKADVLMVSDTTCAGLELPTIIMGLRGIVHVGIRLTGPDHDLHSGVHGGLAPNPAQGMALLLSSLHNSDGSIAVEGYYDSVSAPSEKERSLANAIELDTELYRENTGTLPVAGEKKYTPAERIGFRPSIDINGIHSGYGGEGMKTIIPSYAEARITSRIVAGQDAREALDKILKHLKDNVPEGFKLEIQGKGVGGAGFRLDPGSDLVQRAGKVLGRQAGRDVVFLWEGASIPIVAELAKAANAEPLLVGFGLPEDNIHAPDESFSIEQFRKGFLYAAGMLQELGESQ